MVNKTTKAKETITDDEGEEITYIETEIPDDIQEVVEQEAENTLDDVLARLGAESGDDIKLKVYRYDPDTRKKMYCFDTSPENLPLEPRLIGSYGYGDFAVMVYSPNPNGSKSVRKTVYISIAKELNNSEYSGNNSQQNNPNIMDTVSALIESQNKMMLDFMKTQSLQQENTMLKMVAEMGNKKSDQPTLLETLKLFKELSSNQDDVNPLSMVKELLSVTSEIKDFTNPAPQDGFGALTHGLDSLVELVKTGAANAPQPSPQSSPQPLPPLVNQEQTMNPIEKIMIKKHLKFLYDNAVKGNDAVFYADFALDQIPENFYPQLLAIISPDNETALNNLCQIMPEIANYRDWFSIFCDTIREALTPENLTDTPENLTDTPDGSITEQPDIDTNSENADSSKNPD